MRKSKRLFKKVSQRLMIFVVVFVSCVNACIFSPMQVQAAVVGGAETLVSFTGIGDDTYTYVSGSSPNQLVMYPSWSTGYHTFNIRLSVDGVNPQFSEGNYFVYWADFFFWSGNNNDAQSYLDLTYYTHFNLINPYPNFGITTSGGSSTIESNTNYFGAHKVIYFAGSYDEIRSSFQVEFDFRISYWGVDASNMDYLAFRIANQSLQVFDTRSDYENVLEQIEHNTGETTDAVNNGFNQAMNGYDDSAGSQAASDLDNSASGYESAEDSIFTSSKSALDGFEFFDFNSIPAVVTGLSFITTTATAIFDAMGGTSGAGIVLSVLFAVMFVSIVIGLYRYFK